MTANCPGHMDQERVDSARNASGFPEGTRLRAFLTRSPVSYPCGHGAQRARTGLTPARAAMQWAAHFPFHRVASPLDPCTVEKKPHQSGIYKNTDFTLSPKVLLVDDEREFVQTLAERLMLRGVRSAVAHDGETALHLIDEAVPEVMILGLKMPGIGGIEVLKRVKAMRPEIEVIILTGHGSRTDLEACLKLGAFACLHKPLDIDLLSSTLKAATDKFSRM